MNNAIAVLTFHHIHPGTGRLAVPPEIFESALRLLMKKHTILSYAQFKQYLTSNDAIAPKCVLLTLDDGYLDNYIHAFPILERLNVPATMFIVTGLISDADQCRSSAPPVDHRILWKAPDTSYFVNTAEITKMHATGLMQFSSHTVTHVKCRALAQDVLMQEFTESHQFIRKMACEEPPYGFCWPGGQFDDTALEAIAQSPYQLAFSTIDGGWRRKDNPYTIRRIDCSSFSGDEKDYFFRLKKKLFVYTTPILGNYYSKIKKLRQDMRNKIKRR